MIQGMIDYTSIVVISDLPISVYHSGKKSVYVPFKFLRSRLSEAGKLALDKVRMIAVLIYCATKTIMHIRLIS